jgi:hypothetical protein
MLLGQADAGKSTLRKQFQLYYTSQAMDNERPSWRPIVYFSIIKAVRVILSELDYENVQLPSSTANNSQKGRDNAPRVSLRRRLLPLVAMEESLASELSGGISIPGGHSDPDIFVRASRHTSANPRGHQHIASERANAIADLVAIALAELQRDIDALWRDPSVKAFMRLRKLRLDDSAPL